MEFENMYFISLMFITFDPIIKKHTKHTPHVPHVLNIVIKVEWIVFSVNNVMKYMKINIEFGYKERWSCNWFMVSAQMIMTKVD
jgi:hypothetical protein